MANWKDAAKKSLENRNYIPPEKRMYELGTGTQSFGAISYGAKKAIENNNLDSYTPRNAEERKVLDGYKNQLTIPFTIEIDGETKNFGNISYDALTAINNNALDNYKFKNNDEKKAFDEYTKFAEEYTKKQREPENFGQGLLHGIGYTLEKIGAGAVDGISDAGKFILAGGAKLLSLPTWGSVKEGLNKTAEYIINDKTVGDVWNNSIESRYRIPDWYRESVGNATFNIGSLAPSIAAEVATYSASPMLELQLTTSAAKAGIKGTIKSAAKTLSTKLTKPKVSDVVFGLSAAGSAAEVGYKKSGDVGKALNYGVLNGLGEIATERLFGGIGGTGIGADELWDVGKTLSKIKGVSKLASNKYGKKVLDITFEGVEEVLMASADPIMQTITFNPDANLGELYKNAGFGESFFQGMLLSTLMNAGTFAISKTANTINKTKAINVVNNATNGINALLQNDADKLVPLKHSASLEEIKQRQNEIGVFTMAYADIMVDELVKNNPEKFASVEKVSVGDKFKDTKTGYTITVVERDTKGTTVEINTGVNTITKQFTNKQADNFVESEQLVDVESSDTATPPIENTVVAENATTENKVIDDYESEADELLNTDMSEDETSVDTVAPQNETTDKSEITATINPNPNDIGETYTIYGADAELITEKVGLKNTPVDVNGEKVPHIGLSPDAFNIVSQELKKQGVTLKVDNPATNTETSPTEETSPTNNVAVAENTTTTETENKTVVEETTTDNNQLPEALKTDENGKIRFDQIDIDYTNTTMRKGQFKTVNVGWKSQTVDGFLCGKYGVHKSDKTDKYVVTLLQSGMTVSSFDKVTEAKKVAAYLNANLSFNDVSYNKMLSGSFAIERIDEFQSYLSEVKKILDNKEYEQSESVVTEIKDGKVPFKTKAGLVEYVKSHIGDKVKATFNNGNSEVRTLHAISNTSLRTKRPDGSVVTSELKGVEYNDNGIHIDFKNGVAVTFDFVNVGETELSKSTNKSNLDNGLDNKTKKTGPDTDTTISKTETVEEVSDEVLKNQSESDTIKEKPLREEGAENVDNREYDSSRETQLRENEKDGIHKRGNQTDIVGDKEHTDRTEEKNYSNSEKEHNGKSANRGIIRGVFHGTPYQFSTHIKSYVDLAIHYGTEEQAKKRLSNNRGNIVQADLILNNPLVTADIFGERTPEQYVKALVEKSKLSENEKNDLKGIFDDFAKSEIESIAAESLDKKLSDGSHRITTKVNENGIYVSLVVVDEASNTNEIPMMELIDKNKLIEIIGSAETAEVIKNSFISEKANDILAPYIFETVLPFEKQYLQLRKIEEILQSFGYDGFVYQNDNEGEGWSYAVFNDSQIIRVEDGGKTKKSTPATKNKAESDVAKEPDNTSPKSKGTKQIADYVAKKLAKGEKISALELSKVATEAFGGTMANNVFTVKDAYDAMELGVNQHILSMKDVSTEKMLELLELLPTQTKRTEEMDKFQQFSTPPSIAYLANYTANVNKNDIMLEPSAGIGGIAVFAKKDGAKVYVNELDERRLDVLKNMPFDGFFNEDAEQLNNILGGEIEPTVIVMNPPFSSSSERNMKNTKIGAKHIEQALKILAPNGRLVAIVGKGMADGEPAFRTWWKDIKLQYNVRANIGINGKNYNKYGTNFDIQMLVIDKNGATTDTVTGYVDTLQELQEKLGGIRDERPAIDYSGNEQRTPAATRSEVAPKGKTADNGNSVVSDTSGVADKGKSTDNRGTSGKSTNQNIQSTDAEHGKSSSTTSENTDVVDNGQSFDERGKLGGNTELQDNGRTDVSDSGQHSEQSDVDRSNGKSGNGQNNVRVQRRKRTELTDSIFEQYQTQPLKVKNAQPHPARVSESAAMSAIEPPAITYKPNLPKDIVEKGVVSDVQLEAISYAGQSHSQTLPNGTTRGFFLGDGTGIGKGRTIAGMILDNYNQGRKKSVWVTLNSSLVNDAKRDVTALFGKPDLVTQFVGGNKADSVLNTDEAIMVVSYSALAKGFDNKDSNFEKIVNWLGKDFDGLIVFDEAHKMGNATSTKGTRGMKKASQTGLAGIALQEALPKAKIVYSSATGATEVENLRYAERLGLWGEGTPFINGGEFVSKIKAGGLAAMELIARDMKAMGVYLSRNISYDDVQYDKITHNLTAPQTKIYDELARSWQIVLQNINKALESTNQDKDGHARGRALGAFWSSQQRFFNQILTSMQVPSVISDIEKQLADGKSCVIQLVSTNEAAQNQEFERLKSEDLELDEFDLTPKQVLMSLIENSFPVQQFETYRDDNGNVRSKPVVDSKGKPVVNREAVQQRDELLAKLGSIKVPSSPIDMIINHFGTDMVAENTGRARRVIQKDGKTIEEKIGNKKDADVDAFQNGNKRIIIFSKAGGTGKSYHADKTAKNQQQRVHYLLEAGWQADNAVQGFGRSHRSNQVSAPIFKLVTTNLKGQMRFISTIAKRLDQLGAMTKGQRQAGSQGMFSASDNLENSFAADVLAGFYKDLLSNKVEGIDDGMAILEKLGLRNKILDEYGRIIPTAPELREVNKFLNRILSLESSEQNTVFEGYSHRLQEATENAMQAGTLDKGLENYIADKITLNEVQDIKEDERSGAKTKYYNLTAEHKVQVRKFADVPTDNKSFVGFYQNKNTGALRAVFQTSSTTDKDGNVVSNYKLMGQTTKAEYIPQNRFYGNWTQLNEADVENLWNEEVSKLPSHRQENLHLISGVVLPVWDKLPTENVRIYRVLTSDGEMLIGRVIPENMIDQTLRRLGSSRTKEKIATKDLIGGIKNGNTVILDNGWKIVQRKVSGENRIELVGASYEYHDLLKNKGVFAERIQYFTRYFIPADVNTEQILDEVLKISPVSIVENAKYSVESEDLNDEARKDLLSGNSDRGSNESSRKQTKRISDFKRKLKGKTKAERRSFAKELLAKGQTEEITDGTHQFNVVKPEAYNDDMLSIVEEAKANGKEVGFFIGHGKRKFTDLKIDAIEDGTKILLRYDGFFSPQSLLKHEDVHIEWDNPEMQKAKDIILNDLSEAEKNKILAEDRYKQYMAFYNGNKDKVLQEFVADVFAGMNEYSSQYIDLVVDYWYDGEIVDNYKVSEYTESIDTGNQALLDDIGFGDEYRLSESGELNGYEQNSNSEELGQLKNSGETERYNRVGEVGHSQSQEPNTPHTKSVHRSGVSAETITSSGLTAEQAALKEQNKAEKMSTEFYVKATENGVEQSELFVTENTVYYPDAAFERNDISVKNGVASFTEQRFNDLIEEYSVPVGGQSTQNYATGYAAYISPSDFLKLTAINEDLIVLDTARYGNLDVELLKNNGVRNGPYLTIDFNDGRVRGHEGRHRMVMLRDAGIEKVAIVIKDKSGEQNRYKTTKHTNIVLRGQKFDSGESAPGKVTLDEIIPLSPAYRDEVADKFVNNDADIHYSFSVDDDTEQITPERKREILEQYERDRVGIEKPTQKQLWGERAEWIAHNVSRVFPNIPERGERGTFFAEFRKNMIQWNGLSSTADFMVKDKLNKMTEGLTPDEFKTFSELVYFLDLQEEAQIQKDRGFDEILLPNEITPDEVDAIIEQINEEATENVKNALAKRQQIWNDLKEQYIALNQHIGFNTDEKFKRKNYYHHQVIEYMNSGSKGTGSREINIKAGRGWLKERQGSTKAINTDFLAVEHKAMLQMQYDIYVAQILGKTKDRYDIKPQLEKQAFNNNKKLLNDIIIKEATDENGEILVDRNGKPDSETYREQQSYNRGIMRGFSGLFELAELGALPTFNGQYSNAVNALIRQNLNAPGLYNYVARLASMELSENATNEEHQAQISAKTVLKYTSQKKAWVKEVLGSDYQTWETLAKSMSDTHTIHQPRRGNYFYTKEVLNEDAFDKAFNDMIVGLVSGENGIDTTEDIKKLFGQYSETIRQIGAAYEQWVLPNEIVTTMQEVGNPKAVSEGQKMARAIMSTWKGAATSVNPFRTVKFGIRNMAGDLDAVIAGNPKILRYSKQAIEEIYQAMRHKNYSDSFMEFVERGGYTSMIFANEMDTEMQEKFFSHLMEKTGLEGKNISEIPASILKGYQNGVETAHNFREAILRYSAYLYYKDAINRNGGAVKDYVASNRYIVKGLESVEDKAYQLAKDLLGAYDEVGKMGQTLRRYWIPFYSFTETNMKRYYRLFENIIMSDDNIPKKAGKLLLKSLMVNLFGLLLIAWNKLVMKEDDDKLPTSARNVPHLTLGRIGDNVYAFRQLGSFSEILEWIGLEDYKWESADEPFKEVVNKAYGMINPGFKYLFELPSGMNSYPDVFKPSPIRDRMEYLANSWGVAELYNEISGKPTKGLGEIIKDALVYSYDVEDSVYNEIRSLKYAFQGKDDGTTYKPNKKSNALYYMKKAVKYKDKETALKYLNEYFENGGTAKGITQSFSTLNPMYGFTGKDTIKKGEEFIATLTPEEKEKLKIAQDYYEKELMLPASVSSRLGKKNITEEEAKNLLKNYINSVCK